MGRMRNHRGTEGILGLALLACILMMGMLIEGRAAAASTAVVTRQVVYEVLTSFKQGISSDPSQALASWNTTSSIVNPCTSNWTGISCQFLSNDNPDLISSLSFDLHDQSLRGSVTAELARLGPALSHLDLSTNNLSGTFTSLSNFSTLQNLQYLSLAQNNFHGLLTLPPSCFPNLLFLSVAENSFSGPLPANQLSRCPSLQLLNVSNNKFTGSFFPSGLGNLTATLYNLDAGVNNFSGPLPPSIGNCSLLNFLSLPINNLSGSIPSAIGQGCPNLKFFSLFSNNMGGDIPKEMGFLSNLSYLSLGFNRFTGKIFDILANCTALSTLDISQMFITGRMPDDIGSRFPNLRSLNLEFNLLTGSIPKSLGNCSQLDYLLMGFNYNISGTIPSRLFQAKFISQLDLQHNSFSGSLPHEIRNLTLLQKAYLNNNQFTGSIPEEVSMLASIQAFTLEHNSLSGNFPNQFFNCTTLTYLKLHDNSFIGSVSSSIGFLRSLEDFDASSNQLTGQLPLELSNCTSLRSISLGNNMLSGQMPTSIITGLAKCLSFEFANNNLTGPIPNAEFGSMIFLQDLDLSYNEFSGLVPSGLAGCADLHSLNLSQNNLAGPIPPGLGPALLSLIKLNLSHNSINGSIPEELGSLRSLQQLDLSSNALSGTIPPALASLKGLRFLNLSYNSQLQGEAPGGGVFGNLTTTSFLGDSMLCGIAVNKTCIARMTRAHLSTKLKTVSIIVAASVFLIIMTFILVLLINWRKRKLHVGRLTSWNFDPYIRLTMKDIQQATQNFSVDNILGVGATGTVYKGTTRDGTTLAFKKFNLDDSSIRSFIGELQSVGSIRHRNLIKILSYVSNQVDANILILEYMPNGSLYDHLHGQDQDKLSWEARLRVAVGVAEGVRYLHHDCPSPVIHCDLKPQNILFDENMEVHLTDFGLAKVMAATAATSSFTDNMKGTLGYMAPEMATYGRISRKCDVYSYGILLMELISGCKPFEDVGANGDENEGSMTLVQWVASKLEADEITNIVDKRLQERFEGIDINQVKLLVHLAVQCTQTNPMQRPTMQQVVQALSSTTSSVYQPKKSQAAILEESTPSSDKPTRLSF